MKELQLVLDDDALYQAIQTEAETTGHTIQEIVIQALRQWRVDSELDMGESADLADAHREWQENGGMEAHTFFESLREQESDSDR